MNTSPAGDPVPHDAGSRQRAGWSFLRYARLALKELRETLRDRRTIVTLVTMPLLIYPLIGVTFQKFLFAQLSAPERVEYRIGVATDEQAALLQSVFAQYDSIMERQRARARASTQDTSIESSPGTGNPENEEGIHVQFQVPNDPGLMFELEKLVSSQAVDLGVRVVERQVQDNDGATATTRDFELVYLPQSPRSAAARAYVERRFRSVNEAEYRRALRRMGVPSSAFSNLTTKSVEAADAGSAYSLATLVPLILILMTVTGAVYPAIDLTAGERERGTLETLIAAPVPRMGLLVGKYFAVWTVAILTAGINLAAMWITMNATGLDSLILGDAGLTFGLVIQVFALLIVFAGFFSAVLLCLTSFARSFKEAQAYLIPLMLVSIAPGVLSLMPGLVMNGWLAVTPLVNIVLLTRDLLQGQVELPIAGAAVASTLVYAVCALIVAARIFGTDAILYGSRGTWGDLFRRPEHPTPYPTLVSALGCVAVLFPGAVVFGSIPARITHWSVAARLVGTSVITICLFAMLPWAIARFGRIDVRTAFRLRRARVPAFVAAGLLGISLWPFAYELVLRVTSLDLEQLHGVAEVLAELRRVPLWLKLVVIALVPAACEEFFFRGYLLTALLRRTSVANSVLISSLLFGLFHVVVRESLFVERLLPSTILGIVLALVSYRTGSVLPGMLLHASHNGLFMLVSQYQQQLADWGLEYEGRSHLPTSWLIAAAVVASTGTLLLWWSTRGISDRQIDGQTPLTPR